MIFFSPTARVTYGAKSGSYVTGLTPPERKAARDGHIILFHGPHYGRREHLRSTPYKAVKVCLSQAGHVRYLAVNYLGRKSSRVIPYTMKPETETVIHKRRTYRLKPQQYKKLNRTECGQYAPEKSRTARVRWDTVTCKICLKARRARYDAGDNYINI